MLHDTSVTQTISLQCPKVSPFALVSQVQPEQFLKYPRQICCNIQEDTQTEQNSGPGYAPPKTEN